MMRSRYQKLLLAFSLAASWSTSAAQQNSGDSAFQWRWTGNMVSTQLTQCQSYDVTILPHPNNESSFGTPPYYMIAWKVNGIPTVSYIGSDRNNLSWTVNQASGSTLMLTVADSEELSGGEATYLYNVTAGPGDTSCLPTPPSTNITLAANLSTSDPLETCDPLGLRVYGGEKPYTISLQALSSPVVTNITLNHDDDVLTWPNLADPGGQLMVSVSDANGEWGTSTGIFRTGGPPVTNETRCSTISSSGNSADVDQNPPRPSKSNTTAIVVGVVVPIVVIGLLAVLGFFLWRRRQKEKSREAEPAFLPDAWMGPSFIETGDGSAPFSPYDPPPSSKLARYRDEVNTHSRTSSGLQGIAMGHLSAGSSGTPRQTGAFDAYSGAASGAGSRSNEGHVGGKGGPRLPPGMSPDWTVEPDIIIQHRDGGAVQEIPPPYPSFIAQPEPSRAPPDSPAPGSYFPAGLTVAESSFGGSSRPSSSSGPSAGSSAPLLPQPAPYKGKGRATTDLLS